MIGSECGYRLIFSLICQWAVHVDMNSTRDCDEHEQCYCCKRPVCIPVEISKKIII